MSVRILILEDDPFIALDLAQIVETLGHEIVEVCNCNAAAQRQVDNRVDFALLDIDVRDGKSFPVANALEARGIPFAFVSGSSPKDLPIGLRNATFIPKPFSEAAILRMLPR
jgi:DNA-binding response OmpR family regulator